MTDPAAPARWLIEEYEATDPDDITLHNDLNDDREWALCGSVYVQPIFTFKSVMDTGQPMRVYHDDYDHPDPWWL